MKIFLIGITLVLYISTVFAAEVLRGKASFGGSNPIPDNEDSNSARPQISAKIPAGGKISRRRRRPPFFARPRLERPRLNFARRASGTRTCPEKCICRAATRDVSCVFKFLTEIPQGIPENVEKINLGLNKIVKVAPGSFANHSSTLRYIHIHSNDIRSLDNGMFSTLNKLEVLKLSWNKLTGIRKATFQGLQGLESLYLDNNKLTFIHPLAFRGLVNLRFLQLEGNKLSRLHRDVFVTVEFQKYFKLSTLHYLFLTKNSFTHFPRRMFDHMHELRSIYFHNNPWECSCETKWLKQWMEKENKDRCRKNSWRLRAPSECAVCNWPRSLRGRRMDDIASSEFKCERPFLGDNSTRNEFDSEEIDLQNQVALFRYSDFYSTRMNLRLDSYSRSMLHASCSLTGIPTAKVSEIEQESEGNSSQRTYSASFEGQMRCLLEYPATPTALRDLLEPYLDREINLTLRDMETANLGQNMRIYTLQVEKLLDRPSSLLTAASISSESDFMLSKSSTILIQKEGVGLEENAFRLTFRSSFTHAVDPESSSDAVRDPWVLIRQPHSSSVDVAVALEKKTVNFKCKTTGQPKPKISWISPSEEVIHAGVKGTKYTVSRSGRLYIRKPAPEDSGYYRCIATASDPDSASGGRSNFAAEIATMKLEVFSRTRSESESMESFPTENIAEGENWSSECNIKGFPRATIGWITPDDQMVFGEGKGRHGRIVTDENGTITIPDFKKTDQGLYRCVAANIAGREEYSVIASVSSYEDEAVNEDEAMIEEFVIMDFDADYDEPETPDLSHPLNKEPVEPQATEVPASFPVLESLDIDNSSANHKILQQDEDATASRESNGTEKTGLDAEPGFTSGPNLKPDLEFKPESKPNPEFNLETGFKPEPNVEPESPPDLDSDLESEFEPDSKLNPEFKPDLVENLPEATIDSHLASADDVTSSSPKEPDIEEIPTLEATSPKYWNFLTTPIDFDKTEGKIETRYRTHLPQETISTPTSSSDIETMDSATTTDQLTGNTIVNPTLLQQQTDSDPIRVSVQPTRSDGQTLLNITDTKHTDIETDEHVDPVPTQPSSFQTELDLDRFFSLKGRPDGTLKTLTIRRTDTQLDTDEDYAPTDRRTSTEHPILDSDLKNSIQQTEILSTDSEDIDGVLPDKLHNTPTRRQTEAPKSIDEMMAEPHGASVSANNKIISAVVKMPGSGVSKSLPEMTSSASPSVAVMNSKSPSSRRHRANSYTRTTSLNGHHTTPRRRVTSSSHYVTNSRRNIEVPARRIPSIGFVETPAKRIDRINGHSIDFVETPAKTINGHSVNGKSNPPEEDIIYGRENQRIALPCLPIDRYYAPRAWTFTWRLPSGEEYSRPHRIFSRDWSKFIHTNGSLLLRSLKTEDTGLYSCVAVDKVQNIEYDVEVNLVVRSHRPRIHNAIREYIRLEAGDPLFLPCMVTGNPQPQTYWETPWGTKINFGRMSGRLEVFENGTLYTPDILSEERGAYRCIAKSVSGFAARMVTVTVLTHPPRFLDHARRTEHVKTDHSIALSCAATGFPKPKFYWILPNGGKIYANQAIFSSGHRKQPKYAVMNTGSLVLARADDKDVGRYHCVIANYLGRAASTILLLVAP